MRWLLFVAIAACGRIDFEPVGPGGPSGDGSVARDARRDGAGSPADALTACTTSPIVVTQGVRAPASTCSGHDLIDGCGPTATQEVVFAFTAPASGSYQFQAYDPGTNTVSNTTGVTDGTCTMVQMCSGILGLALDAGDTVYLVVEADAGGCASIEFEVI